MTDLIVADVSEFQGVIDWAAYGAQHPAVIIRACYGAHHPDNYWSWNIAGARAHCRVRGIYQYLVASQPVEQQAAAFVAQLKTVGGLQPGEFTVVDIEEGDPGAAFAAGDQWVRSVQSQLGGTAWEYSYLAFMRHPVQWLAAYQGKEPTAPHALWQFTDRYQFAGISQRCDASLFHGTVDQLAALINNNGEFTMDAEAQAAFAAVNTKLDFALGALGLLSEMVRPMFVDSEFEHLLNRLPDDAGRAFWLSQLTGTDLAHPAAKTPTEVDREIVGSEEHKRVQKGG